MRNVVLFVLDSVRKDVFDEVAVRLRSRADVEYEQCRAASSWSVPSHASLFTGELPSEHGVHTYARHYTNVSDDDTFLSRMPDHRTVGVSANVFAGDDFGFDGLFDDFVGISSNRRFPSGIDVSNFGRECEYNGIRKHLAFAVASAKHEHPVRSFLNGVHVTLDDLSKQLPVKKPFDRGCRAVERSIRKRTLGGGSREPFFLFANFMDAHGPLTPMRGFDNEYFDTPSTWKSEDVDWDAEAKKEQSDEIERYVGLYRAAVDYLDRRLSRLIDDIQKATSEPTTFVVSADHGENLGGPVDDYLFEHSDCSLSEGLLHVPALIIDSPEGPAPRTDRYVSHRDFGTLLAGLSVGDIPDISAERIAAERIGNNRPNSDEERLARCVYHDGFKDYWDSKGRVARYRIHADVPSHQELLEDIPSIADLEAELFGEDIETAHERARTRRSDSEITVATEEKLKGLGYL
ncbi:sulfatase-like hydrolase/transferase [Halosegnis marinus]|uniref:Sulfatase-like hydrolase/transferase n=1 Tax=Halosegnis marinus TaxID=3034023 RepID=A0ABD5ZKI3_9EURY|nr:sulfatase-like hydrolase/transferase [Halosegnis sp. DT85]